MMIKSNKRFQNFNFNDIVLFLFRMVIPKTCFGLPGKFPVGRRQTAFRVGSKKYQSLPASAPPIP